jgi:WD40 repeat protein
LEAYTCPSVRFHPFEQCFIAQSNANYIAIFSGRSPFKLNKYKRFEGHQVAGFRIQCNFSPDGESLVTGSADGYVYFYNYHSSKLLKKLKAHEGVCSDAVYHPFLPSVVATCGWDGIVSIFE